MFWQDNPEPQAREEPQGNEVYPAFLEPQDPRVSQARLDPRANQDKLELLYVTF